VYAFAFEATRVDLEIATSPGRQTAFFNVIRLMANPDIFTVDPQTQETGFSTASQVTFERMVETVMMALLASTIGILVAVPVSFLGARNIMGELRMPAAGITGALLGLPIGAALFGWLANSMMSQSARLSSETGTGLVSLGVAAAMTWAVLNVGPSMLNPRQQPSRLAITTGLARLLIAFLLAFFALGVLAHLGLGWGRWLQGQLGAWGFIGNFIFVLSDLVRLVGPPFVALIGALFAASIGSRYGQEAIMKLEGMPARLVTAVLATLGIGITIYGIGLALDWLYLFDNPVQWTTIPAIIGGALAGIVSLVIAPRRPFPIGFIVYFVTRAVFNFLRSIETLIMAIVFVIWVGLGPFAGLMALALHSVAALSKLFSEQVESIAAGPVEAITATGANRIQTIAFAVVPQIIPPYIAFSFYRWDINVRMSTIIGFVGGGGIGFVLQQHISLRQYPQASVMMLAIAVVVATLDYLSSRVRNQII
jgi:phosphonate ABC transporter permease subunit PhnE